MPVILLTAFGWLKNLFSNPKTWNFIFLAAIALFVAVKGIEFANSYVSLKVSDAVKGIQNAELQNQITILDKQNKIVVEAAKETRAQQVIINTKANDIDNNIKKGIQNGKDGYTGTILTSTIDGL